MNDVDVVNDEPMREIFCRFKENLEVDLLNAVNSVRCCECGHKSRIQLVQDKMMWFKRMTRLYQIILIIITLAIVLTTYGFWLGRHYNRSIIFGGCSSSWIWPFDDCPVAF